MILWSASGNYWMWALYKWNIVIIIIIIIIITSETGNNNI